MNTVDVLWPRFSRSPDWDSWIIWMGRILGKQLLVHGVHVRKATVVPFDTVLDAKGARRKPFLSAEDAEGAENCNI